MGQAIGLPNVSNRSPSEVQTYLLANTTIRATIAELEEKGWFPLIRAGLVGFTSTGYLVWTGDQIGRRLVQSNMPSSYMLTAEGIAGARAPVLTTGQYGIILQVHNTDAAAGKVIILIADAASDYTGAGANVIYYSATLNADATVTIPFGSVILCGPVYVTASAGVMSTRAIIFT